MKTRLPPEFALCEGTSFLTSLTECSKSFRLNIREKNYMHIKSKQKIYNSLINKEYSDVSTTKGKLSINETNQEIFRGKYKCRTKSLMIVLDH